ncbi:MAG: RnfABCDGE type electron transport complex subunit G [Lachnospiraceae bacterium]|nr:RnfABCDGE type electron transport complex subunit G [Lachnospiraceae bacterium]
MSENKKNSASIIKDALALCLITLVAAVLLGFVNELTKDRIAEQEAAAKEAAYREVYPEAAAIVTDNAEAAKKVAGAAALLKENGFESITIDEAGLAVDALGNTLGYVMTITTKKGYGGTITMTMGYRLDGMITGIAFVTLNETPGFGMKADEPVFKEQFIGKNAFELVYVKTGASAENEIDAISGATVTTKAVTGAVNAGLCFAADMAVSGIGGAVK